MLRYVARVSCFVSLIFAASFLFAQAEFSADIVQDQKPNNPVKVYFAKDKMRVDAQSNGPHGGGSVIINLATQTSIVIMPQQHMYMEMPVQSQAQRIGYSFFETGDVESACGDWQKLAYNRTGNCRKVGDETVNGRSTVKYEGTNAKGDTGYFWLDSKLRFPVKWQEKNSGGELRNIQEGAQPASLFEVPAGFTKMEMPMGMMQQH